MRLRSLARLGILLVLASSVVPVMIGYANVPTVLSMEIETRGEATFLIMEVTHSSPTSTHFVSTAEVEVGDESVIHLDLVPQTSGTFTIEVELETVAESIRARVSCTTHGWSSWRRLSTETDGRGGGIPGFPIAAVAAGLMTAGFLLRRARER
jgi:desulfoferrodoxin (superoxide reductase-like protein)